MDYVNCLAASLRLNLHIAILPLGICPQKNENRGPHKNLYGNSYFIYKGKKLGNEKMSTKRRMDKQIVIYLINVILFSNKRNELLIHANIWMILKSIMLSKRSQSTHCLSPFLTKFKNRLNRSVR